MTAPRPHRAILVPVLLFSLALTAACGRDGAASDQAALHEALSSIAVTKGLTSTGGATMRCPQLHIDCAEIESGVVYDPVLGNNDPVLGNLKACTAAIALQGSIPAGSVRWGSARPGSSGASAADMDLAGVAALRPSPAVMTAACVKALSSKQAFVMLSDLNPHTVQVKSAKAVVTVAHVMREKPASTTRPVIYLTYDGPSW
jgi:hypothetical protein